jgi:hypothetical protein
MAMIKSKGGNMKKEPNIIHVLADGTRVKDITGHVVPKDNAVYQIMFENRWTK